MDIERLRTKRQLNVQEQNALAKDRIARIARSFLGGETDFAWVRDILSSKGLNHNDGILADASSVQCGDGAEAAYATWVSTSGSVYSIEATITASGKLLELDFFADTTDQLGPSRRRGTGKTLSLLAKELMPEVLDV